MKEKIRIVLGDIADAEADAIVNAANSELILGSGVSGAINRKGGPAIQAECDKIAPVRVGDAVVTCAGRLKARFVIHAASASLGGVTTGEMLKSSLKNAFLRAEELQVRTVALPAIGSCAAGFPMRRCAEVMMDEAKRALHRGKVEGILFMLQDQPSCDAFKDAFNAAI